MERHPERKLVAMFCPRCGTVNEHERNHCFACGENLRLRLAAGETMKSCSVCETFNRLVARYCTCCGERFE